MATRKPLMAITAVQALCNIAKAMLDQLMSLVFTGDSFGRETSVRAAEGSDGFRVCSVICRLTGLSPALEL